MSPQLSPVLAFAALVLGSCSTSSGNLYFLSAQRVGLKVTTSDPSANAMPDVNIGYESLKGTINPVKDKDGAPRPDCYSVVGITSTNVGSGDRASLGVAEWFATGRAADIIAGNPASVAAISSGGALTDAALRHATADQLATTIEAIDGAVVWLSVEREAHPKDNALLSALDNVDTALASLSFQEYAADGARKPYSMQGAGWERVRSTRSALRGSISKAREHAKRLADDKQQSALDAADALQAKRRELDQQLLARPEVKAVWSRIQEIVNAGGSR
jgi:uncharacterized membrane protein